jgi:hypothetical protein
MTGKHMWMCNIAICDPVTVIAPRTSMRSTHADRQRRVTLAIEADLRTLRDIKFCLGAGRGYRNVMSCLGLMRAG